MIGVGINVAIEADEFPADLRWPATSIGAGSSVAEVRRALCERLERWSAASRAQTVAAFRERDALRGRSVRWAEGAGIAAGIAEDGNLLVELEGGDRVSLGSGEISVQID